MYTGFHRKLPFRELDYTASANADISRAAQWIINKKGALYEIGIAIACPSLLNCNENKYVIESVYAGLHIKYPVLGLCSNA
jgi:hypothetical protein